MELVWKSRMIRLFLDSRILRPHLHLFWRRGGLTGGLLDGQPNLITFEH